ARAQRVSRADRLHRRHARAAAAQAVSLCVQPHGGIPGAVPQWKRAAIDGRPVTAAGTTLPPRTATALRPATVPDTAARRARSFWLSLFAFAALAVLAFGWENGEPLTAAAFVVFFTSRVWRSVIKRPLTPPRDEDPVRRANLFVMVTAGGY